MKPTLLARKLNVAEFARQHDELDGSWPLSDLPRLGEACVRPLPASLVNDNAFVHWRAQGERRVVAGGVQNWLHLEIQVDVPLQCQRCLAPVVLPLSLSRTYRFVASEAEAEREDGESEEDLLVITRSLDLAQLCEDEILMALPVVPLHEVCPAPLVPGADSPDMSVEALPDVAPDQAQDDDGRPHPFEALAALRGKLH